jgi:hypothetical protein
MQPAETSERATACVNVKKRQRDNRAIPSGVQKVVSRPKPPSFPQGNRSLKHLLLGGYFCKTTQLRRLN